MNLFRLTVLFLAIIGIAHSEESPPTISSFFQTPENREIVASPQKVDVCVLREKKSFFSKRSTGKYKEGKYITLPPESVALISATLQDEKTYDWERMKLCHPIYNARVRFHRNGHFIYADFCFGCDILLLGKDGSAFRSGNFDDASDAICELLRIHFPEDPTFARASKLKKAEETERARVEELVRVAKEKKAEQQNALSETPGTP